MKSQKPQGGNTMYGLTPYRRRRNQLANHFLNDDLFRSFFGNDAYGGSISIDVKDEKEKFLVEAEMPGIKKEQIKIDVHDGILTISANEEHEENVENQNYVYRERRTGSISRSLSLDNIKEDEITAKYENGILRIDLPKADPEKSINRTIDIQ